VSTFEIDSNIRIVVPTSELSRDSRDGLIGSNAVPSKDMRTWTIDVHSDPGTSSVENSVETCLDFVRQLRSRSWWVSAWSVTVWLTVSSPGEFVGLVFPPRVSKQAGELEVDLVVSVYCSQK
jgi:hypothetical protein